MIAVAAAVVGGMVLWTFMEYTLHRFAFHESPLRWYGSLEHKRHHASRRVVFNTATWLAWGGILSLSFLVLVPIGTALWSAPLGWALGSGYAAGYFGYEALHLCAHLRPPRTRYGRWLRQHHFRHHFQAPLRNHGVTVSVWDHLFGTYDPPQQVAVPRRMAPPWLLDAHGEVRPEFRQSYSARGPRDLDGALAVDDHHRAMVNEAPRLDAA